MVVCEHVTLSVASRPVVVGLHCVVSRGTAAAVVGPAEAGKSLFLAAIMGLVAPIQGRIAVDGVAVGPLSGVVRQRSCFVPSRAPLLPYLTALEQARFLAALAGRQVSRRAAITALRLSEVPDRLFSVQTKALGVFERLCVWLAGHRLRETSLLLVDDPSQDLTARQAKVMARLIRESLSPDKSIIITSRDPEFGHAVGDQILRLDHEHVMALSERRPNLPDVSPMTTR